MVAEAVAAVEATHGGNGHRFVAELPDEPLDAEADRDKLRQVLAILLDNAVATRRAGGTVTVAARRAHDNVELRVVDEGIGIPRPSRSRSSASSTGARAARRVGTGSTGLGLFIAEGLVTAMGGRIWVDSPEGKGSSFAFELPAPATETAARG